MPITLNKTFLGNELISNGDFETGDFTGWVTTGTPSVTSTQKYKGAYSALCGAGEDIYRNITVSNKGWYRYAIAMRQSVQDSSVAYIVSNTTHISIALFSPPALDTWHFFEIYIYIPDNATQLYIEGNNLAGGDCFYDNFSLRRVLMSNLGKDYV